MPLFDFRCPVCGAQVEKFIRKETEVICTACDISMIKMMPLLAKTATLWNGGWNSGLDGQGIYSHALGKKVHNRREEAKIMEARGFVSESDLAPHWWEDQVAKKEAKVAEQDRLTQTYNDKVTEYGGDKIRAMTETFTTEACLDGSLHDTFDEKISI
jgi:hypothetical protein